MIWFTWYHHHSGVSMVVADALAPIWRQDISNYHDDAGRSTRTRSAPIHWTMQYKWDVVLLRKYLLKLSVSLKCQEMIGGANTFFTFPQNHPAGKRLNLFTLTHWVRVTHICVGNLTIIVSDNGLSPGWRQASICTNAGILLIWPLGANFSEISIEISTVLFKKIRLKGSSAKWRSFFSASMSLKLFFLFKLTSPGGSSEVGWGGGTTWAQRHSTYRQHKHGQSNISKFAIHDSNDHMWSTISTVYAMTLGLSGFVDIISIFICVSRRKCESRVPIVSIAYFIESD